MNGPAAIERLFAEAFGRSPQGVWAAPGRVNLIGEHTDYNEGFVLPFALDRCALAAVAFRDDGKARCLSADLGAGPEVALADIGLHQRPGGWSAYPLGVAWALAEMGVKIPGFDLLVTSDVPLGAGVSSSAALECCVALALSDLAGAGIDPSALALAGRRAENEIVGVPTGVMDQLVCMRGRAGHAVFVDCRSLAWRHVPFEPARHGLSLLVVDTKIRHALVNSGYGARRKACEEAAGLLGVASLRDATEDLVESARGRLGEDRYRRAWHVVTENGRVLDTVAILAKAAAGGSDLGSIGALLSASHASLRDCYEVSCAALDAVCQSAEQAGALGARMIGGGFGGSAIALMPTQLVDAVTSSVMATAQKRGFPMPGIFATHAVDGARRVG